MDVENVAPAVGATGEAESSAAAAAPVAGAEEKVETQDAGAAGDGVAQPATGAGEGHEGVDGEDGEEPEKHRRKGGYQRQIERLQRDNQILLEQLQRHAQQQPVATPQGKTQQEMAAEQAQQALRGFFRGELEAMRAQEMAQAQVAAFKTRCEEAKTRIPDLEEEASAFDVPTNSALGQAILTSECGPEIMYQLAKNPAELARIRALPPLDAARAIGRLEAKASGAAPKPPPGAAPRRTPASAPITPVTARGPTTVKPVEQMSYEEYSAWRRSQSKR